MEIHVRDSRATCSCGSNQFEPPHGPPYRTEDLFSCARCGRKQRYGALLEQIGDDAMKRARSSLDALKRDSGRKKEKNGA